MRAFLKSFKIFWQKIYRILWKSADGFMKNEDTLKASALTYYTLISIVPFFAVAFGIASGFGFADYLEEQLKQGFYEQKEVIAYSIRFAQSLLQDAKNSVIVGVGLIALFWTNLSMLASVESALNDIWRVRQPRSWAKKITDYLAVMFIAPIFVVVSSSLSLYIITQITQTARDNPYLAWVSTFLMILIKAIPFFLSILLFIMIYTFLPNVRIHLKPRIIAGIIAGIAFQLWQWLYIKFQVEISNYGAIYGTFAALPLFLLWLWVSWLILLAGAEMAAHIESETSYSGVNKGENFCTITQKQLGLLILYRCIRAYKRGDNPPTALQIAQDLGIPLMTAQHMLDILVESGILVEAYFQQESRHGYQPSRDATLYNITNVCNAIEKQTDTEIPIECSPALNVISEQLQQMEKISEESSANKNFNELLNEIN